MIKANIQYNIIRYENVYVDGGQIGIIDSKYLKSNGGIFDPHLQFKIKLKKGKYEFIIKSDETWNGKVKKTHILDIENSVIVGDTGYGFNVNTKRGRKYWDIFLDNTNYLEIENDKYFVLNTGGDGSFDIEILWRKLEDLRWELISI